jgi:hypothetical protein
MLLICGDDEAHKAMEADGSFLASCHAWADEMQQRRVLVTIAGLQSPSDATTVRIRGDQVLLTDGPFADTKEVIGGFSLVECADLDAPRNAPRTPSRRRSSAGRATAFPVGPERG